MRHALGSAIAPPPVRCEPPRWARSGHAQTLWGHLLPSPGKGLTHDWPEAVEHAVGLDGGDRLNLVHVPAPGAAMQVVLFHGLSGTVDADYIRRTTSVARGRGASILAVNHRGCGSGRGLAAGPCHAGRAEDLAACLRFGRELEPGAQQLAIAFSLSGNALLLLLTQKGLAQPDGAIALHPPIHLAEASRRLHQGWNRLFEWRFLHRLRAVVKQRMRDGLIERHRLPRTRTLWEFDDLFTAPASGFHGADDYYTRCSTRHLLREIETPTIILSSRDDPFVSVRDFQDARLSDTVHLHLEAHGGHLGYLHREATPLGTKRWLDYALDHYLSVFDGKGAI